MSWSKAFDDPILLSDGRQLLTLKEAAEYIIALPKAEHDAEEWQAAMQALLLVAEHDGPTMFARIGVIRHSMLTMAHRRYRECLERRRSGNI